MSVIKFPSKLPPPDQLDLSQVHVVGLLQSLTELELARANELMDTGNATEFAAVVRSIAEDTADAAAGWEQLSNHIRASWGV